MHEKLIENKELNIWEALIGLLVVVILLTINIFYADGVLFAKIFGFFTSNHFLQALGDDYSNQLILLTGAFVAAIVGFLNNVKAKAMLLEIWDNIKQTSDAIIILALVGALSGTWLISGIIPTMIYYGLQILNPSIFLPATVIIAALISLATGSSWTTSATVGIALIGIGTAIGINPGMIAGAVVSGAYFGDKISPLSDTTNLAPAMAGTELFTHIKYMFYTTIPTFIITLIVFSILSFTIETKGAADVSEILTALKSNFNISPVLFLVPAMVVLMVLLKAKPYIAILSSVILAAIFAVIFQANTMNILAETDTMTATSALKTITKAIFIENQIITENESLNGLFTSKGMQGMLWTIYLILSALAFGGVMESIGALSRISSALLKLSNSIFGLFASTVASCLAINLTASDQYLAIVVPGKMFAKAYKEKGLAPENLSRTLEDSGTVTSALIPWNTCGAYQSSVLGVSVADYFIYAVFNYVSPFMTLLFAAFNIKIRQLKSTI